MDSFECVAATVRAARKSAADIDELELEPAAAIAEPYRP